MPTEAGGTVSHPPPVVVHAWRSRRTLQLDSRSQAGDTTLRSIKLHTPFFLNEVVDFYEVSLFNAMKVKQHSGKSFPKTAVGDH